jgi:hypothetical protein
MFRVVVVVGLLALSGCTATPEPQASPTWEPDTVVTTSFSGVTCEIRIRVAAVDDTPNAETQLMLANARVYLATTDWNTDVTLEDYDPEVLAARRDRGTPEPMLLTMLVQDGMTEAISASGLITPQLQTEGFTSCDT